MCCRISPLLMLVVGQSQLQASFNIRHCLGHSAGPVCQGPCIHCLVSQDVGIGNGGQYNLKLQLCRDQAMKPKSFARRNGEAPWMITYARICQKLGPPNYKHGSPERRLCAVAQANNCPCSFIETTSFDLPEQQIDEDSPMLMTVVVHQQSQGERGGHGGIGGPTVACCFGGPWHICRTAGCTALTWLSSNSPAGLGIACGWLATESCICMYRFALGHSPKRSPHAGSCSAPVSRTVLLVAVLP